MSWWFIKPVNSFEENKCFAKLWDFVACPGAVFVEALQKKAALGSRTGLRTDPTPGAYPDDVAGKRRVLGFADGVHLHAVTCVGPSVRRLFGGRGKGTREVT